jgi:hypothetical protein
MIIVLVLLAVLWLAAGIIGLLFKGMLWLTIIAALLLIGTIVAGALRRNTRP